MRAPMTLLTQKSKQTMPETIPNSRRMGGKKSAKFTSDKPCDRVLDLLDGRHGGQ